jgi:IS1 family transposase
MSTTETTMTQKFHTMSIEDREMFAYNAAYQRKQQQLAKITPEQRIKYAFEFLKDYLQDCDAQMVAKCYDAIAKYSEQLDYSEAHF